MVFSLEGGNLTLSHCKLSGNTADSSRGGGAIDNEGGMVTLDQCDLSDNHANF
jgi:hypothetical protein